MTQRLRSMAGPQKKWKIEFPCDPAITLLGVYSKGVTAGAQRGLCAPIFVAALFAIGKRWKQSKCP